jgi:hypothetical protein
MPKMGPSSRRVDDGPFRSSKLTPPPKEPFVMSEHSKAALNYSIGLILLGLFSFGWVNSCTTEESAFVETCSSHCSDNNMSYYDSDVGYWPESNYECACSRPHGAGWTASVIDRVYFRCEMVDGNLVCWLGGR